MKMTQKHQTVAAPRQRRYPTDLTDAEWNLLAPFLAPNDGPGAPRTIETRAVVDALFYKLRTGCQWRMLPADFPNWSTVYYWREWGDDGTWERVNTVRMSLSTLTASGSLASHVAILTSLLSFAQTS